MILLTTFDGPDELHAYNIDDPSNQFYYNFEKGWNRFKTHTEENFLKVANKLSSSVSKIQVVDQDRRIATNYYIDQNNDVMIISFEDGKAYLDIGTRTNEDGEHINSDGVPLHLCDMNGTAYPEPPPGLHRYRIDVSFPGGTYGEYHRMWMAATPKQAAQECIDHLAKEESPLMGFLNVADILQTMVMDVDTDETVFFAGPNLQQNSETDMLTNMFKEFVGDDG